MGRHFLDVDAGIVRTEDYALCQRAVADVVGAGAMAVVHGQAGAGKTLAVEDAVAATGEHAVFLAFPRGPRCGASPRSCARACSTSTRPCRPEEPDPAAACPARRRARAHRRGRGAAPQPRMLRVLRYLHDPAERGLGAPACRSPMVLVGGDQAWGVLAVDAMLRSRVYRRVHCRRLRPEQVLAWMPRFHPLYADAAPELLSFVDHHSATACSATGPPSPARWRTSWAATGG